MVIIYVKTIPQHLSHTFQGNGETGCKEQKSYVSSYGNSHQKTCSQSGEASHLHNLDWGNSTFAFTAVQGLPHPQGDPSFQSSGNVFFLGPSQKETQKLLKKNRGHCGRRLLWYCYRRNIACFLLEMDASCEIENLKSFFWSHQVHLQIEISPPKMRQKIHKNCCFVCIHLVLYTSICCIHLFTTYVVIISFGCYLFPPQNIKQPPFSFRWKPECVQLST